MDTPADGNHALLIGMVWGSLMRDLDAETIIDENGDYLDTIRVRRPSGVYLIRITPEGEITS